MAARNSCTKFTWAEAKSKSNPNSSSSSSGAKANLRKIPHNKILAEKLIAKSGNRSNETLLSKGKLRKCMREDERARAAIALVKEEKERERRNRVVRPHERARERLVELALELQKAPFKEGEEVDAMEGSPTTATERTSLETKECREMQLDEITALEAMYADTGEFLVSHASRLEEILEIREQLYEDEDDAKALESLMNHPPLSFSVQLTVDDPRVSTNVDDGVDGVDGAETERRLVACILLSVEFPPTYPSEGHPPSFKIIHAMVTDRSDVCSPDKVPESLAFVEEARLGAAMARRAEDVLPSPCVYEVVEWFSENVFGFLRVRESGRVKERRK